MEYIDALVKIGAGSAHPGGFSTTLRQLRNYPLPPHSRILEIGCGTGKTACYLAAQGHIVSAIDIHERMIEKAIQRSSNDKVTVDFAVGNVTSLPFEENSFDIVMAESVLNFTDVRSSLAECFRVLSNGGVLYAREILSSPDLPDLTAQELGTFFGLKQIMSSDQWLDALRKIGYSDAELLEYEKFQLAPPAEEAEHNDMFKYQDSDTLTDLSVWQTLLRHDDLLYDNSKYLYNGLIRATR
jgi:ubiquinone/menaquinone biosynthesis C-methylase UbiE